DLVELARQSAAEYRETAPAHSIRRETDEAELTGQWDAGRLERVIANLVGNAIKYSPNGGEIVLSVRRETTPDGFEFAVLAVRDQGLGIPADDLPRIFDRFWRGANVGVIRGAGIGLAGVKQIVEQHGGTIG